jgi:hypothetical protein
MNHVFADATRRERPFVKTRAIAYHSTATFCVLSSRGFSRELPPTRQTRPALRQRRHSVDILLTRPFDGKRKTVPSDSKSLYGHLENKGEEILSNFEPLYVLSRETDEPIPREPFVHFPDARRHRMLDRERHHHYPPRDEETYLELLKSSLSNNEFRTITVLHYPDGWFADNVLDVALEMVSLEYNADSHNIFIANSLMGQCLYGPGVEGDVDGNNFAGMDEYKRMFENKQWIFIPINDGMVARDTSIAQGAHWSFVAVNRRDLIAHYVDSLYVRDWRYQQLANAIVRGLGNILNEEYEFTIEIYTPHQWYDNKYDNYHGHDVGPCGPFVVTMIKEYVAEIVHHRENGLGELSDLYITPRWSRGFRQIFNSFDVRVDITVHMARLKIKLNADRLADQHDAVVLAGLGNTIEVVHDQQPLFDRRVEEVREGTYETDTDSSVSAILEDDSNSDDLQDIMWTSLAKYKPSEDGAADNDPAVDIELSPLT